MPRPKMTDEQFAAMQDRILDAAVELLHEAGPGGLSIRAIAERAGVSHMGVYTYFDNRDALLAAMRDRQRQRIEAKQEELLEQARTGNVCDAVRQALMIHAMFAKKHPRAYRLFMVEPITNEKQLHHHEARTREQLRHLQALIEIGIERGEFAVRDSFLAAASAVCMINGPLMLYHNGRMNDPDLRDRMVDEILSITLAYLRTGVLQASPEP
jgi:AcrR family transcriptional regulator